MKLLSTLLLATLAFAIATLSTPALADSIDGNWCFSDGRSFSIKGADIVTPSGNQILGNYDRHAFSYVVPDSEPSAGARIAMSLRDQMTLDLTQEAGSTGGSALQVQVWKRCTPTTS